MYRRFLVACSVVAGLLYTRPLHAWNATAHEVIAAMTWDQLSPEERHRIIQILMAAPDGAHLKELYPRYLRRGDTLVPDDRPTDVRDREFFILASTWADQVRGTPYHRPDWHFVEFRFTQPSPGGPPVLQSSGPQAGKLLNVLHSLSGSLSRVSNPDAKDALELAWLIHLLGDLHEPLHVASRVTPVEPEGDRGGNMFTLRSRANGTRESLHAFWDAIFDRTLHRDSLERDFTYIDRLAEGARVRNARGTVLPRDPDSYEAWAIEGVTRAADSVYTSDLERNVGLSDEYVATALRVGETAVARAAYRSARILRAIARGESLPQTLRVAQPVPRMEQPRAEAADSTGPGRDGNPSIFVTAVKVVFGALGGGVLLTSLAAAVALAFPRQRFWGIDWLISAAHPVLQRLPGLGRHVFLRRYPWTVRALPAVTAAGKRYFALPAKGPDGRLVAPDGDGTRLHAAIADAAGEQQPVVLVGRGGAGKSTVLARLAHLAVEGTIPHRLARLTPVLVPAVYYDGDLVKAIGQTLRGRDHVPVDDELIKGQLQSTGFLILFDGVSEVPQEDRAKALREILLTARHGDYAQCRFILATRPIDGIPNDVAVVELLALEHVQIPEILRDLKVPSEVRKRVEDEVEALGAEPILPQVFTIILDSAAEAPGAYTRSAIYERYFQGLLQVQRKTVEWNGWRVALAEIAKFFVVDTQTRGVGRDHATFVDWLSEIREDEPRKEALVTRLQRQYGLRAQSELALLAFLAEIGVLEQDRRWRFAHDTYEEYFLATYLILYFERHGRWPPLEQWNGMDAADLVAVRAFVAEMLSPSDRGRLVELHVGD